MNQKNNKDKLKKALRDNLRKRKLQSRKLGTGEDFAVKLRSRDLSKSQEANAHDDLSTGEDASSKNPDGDKE